MVKAAIFRIRMNYCCRSVLLVVVMLSAADVNRLNGQDAARAEYSVEQITFGPKHYLFGYIGHAGTIPWNASGRYIVAAPFDVSGPHAGTWRTS